MLDVRALVVWLDECTATFRAGNWHIARASGAYVDFKGAHLRLFHRRLHDQRPPTALEIAPFSRILGKDDRFVV